MSFETSIRDPDMHISPQKLKEEDEIQLPTVCCGRYNQQTKSCQFVMSTSANYACDEEQQQRINGASGFDPNTRSNGYNDSVTSQRRMKPLSAGNSYPCKRCNKQFKKKIILEKHLKSRLCNQTSLQCSMITKTDKTETDLETHAAKRVGNQLFTCKVCARNYTRKGGLTSHMKQHTSKKMFPCRICDKTFFESWQCKRHMISHSEKVFWCADCGKGFKDKNYLTSHVRSHAKDFACSFCHKKFGQNAHLKLHLMTHTGERPFTCADCAGGFISKNQLVIHVKTMHTDESRNSMYVVEYADTVHALKSLSSLDCYNKVQSDEGKNSNANLGVQTIDTLFDCDFCGHTFHSISFLSERMEYHKYGKLVCKICGVRFRNKNLWAKHEKAHENEFRPFVCEYCSCRFSKRLSLEGHIKIHTGERPIKCDHCGKRWKNKRDVRRHLMSHTDERPYGCEYCFSRFREENTRTRHIRAKHPEKLCGKPSVSLSFLYHCA
ncbi:hypothetical protein QAD02_017970 [Eretmocerus hayati]|uniref:Uncharacterized protein n=1 Tax=Eretmocerus hayati TaxID=131215 RepID=A0ACC2PFF5_9HYME|nr:hypothetical protein QAD02_017970 [Eretmocerus hayati]